MTDLSIGPVLSPEERQARRAERRAKQRAQNVLRAAKMHMARIAAHLPHTPTRAGLKQKQKIHIGCSGWFYWHWRNIFYPEATATSAWFDHYADRFKTVELNAPFYSWPTVNTVNTWRKQAGRRRFLYTVKVSELITHTRRFEDCAELIKDFGHIADILGPYMGCFLFQCPPSEKYSPEKLHLILSQLDPNRRNVVEFRHASWWNDAVFSAFRETGTIFCSCSGPRLPDALVKTADDIYVRFHGTKQWYRHDYTEEELAIWANRIRESGPTQVWAYFNNDRDGHAIKNARSFRRQLVGA